MEQGSHRELLALDGIFASMWADQISSTEDPAPSIGGTSSKKEITGYIADQSTSSPAEYEVEPEASQVLEAAPVTDALEVVPESAKVVPQEEEVKDEAPTAADSPPIAFPTSDSQEAFSSIRAPSIVSPPLDPVAPAARAPTPLTFPTSDDEPQPPMSETTAPPAVTPGVTFGTNLNAPPGRDGTPDPESEPKRKRISSQNFQRLARRISLTTRRQSSSSMIPSSIIPGLKRSDSPRVSTDDSSARAEPSGSNDSPAGSVKGESDKSKLKKKDKKEKKEKRKGSL